LKHPYLGSFTILEKTAKILERKRSAFKHSRKRGARRGSSRG